MNYNTSHGLDDFFVVGVNYKNTDAATRGRFAISEEQYENILKRAPSFGVDEFFILSTCNRTEIYGFGKNPSELTELLCSQVSDNTGLFGTMAYIKNGLQAVTHLFYVGSGLDSQIVGDYEIVSQLKQAFKFSKDRHFTGSFTERLVSCVLQSSKRIKSETSLSSGTVSVSFSAVKYLREKTTLSEKSNVLVLGAGKIGRSALMNLVHCFGTKHLTIINRSEQKAIDLSRTLGIHYAPMEQLGDYAVRADAIIVATSAAQPILLKSHLENNGDKIVIDLSIPCNVDPAVEQLNNITLIHVDQISQIKDDNIKKRQQEIPQAKAILAEHIDEFLQWHRMRINVPALTAVKTKLMEISALTDGDPGNAHTERAVDAEEKIRLVMKRMAIKMRTSAQKGCHCIQAINEFMMAMAN